jgi:hypothetical protein
MHINRLKEVILKIWRDPVWSKIIAVIIIAIASTLYVSIRSCGNNSKSKDVVNQIVSKKKQTEIASENNSQPELIKKNIISQGELPYLKNITILDKTIYIRYSYNDFLIGGKNITKLKISARTSDGRNSSPKYLSSSDEIEYFIHDKPYIEFEYSGQLYSIEVLGEMHRYRYIIKKIFKATMDLRKINFN